LDVHGLNAVVHDTFQSFCIAADLMDEIMGFAVALHGFDIVEFGRVFGIHPLIHTFLFR
jgi:hypothetical protein